MYEQILDNDEMRAAFTNHPGVNRVLEQCWMEDVPWVEASSKAFSVLFNDYLYVQAKLLNAEHERKITMAVDQGRTFTHTRGGKVYEIKLPTVDDFSSIDLLVGKFAKEHFGGDCVGHSWAVHGNELSLTFYTEGDGKTRKETWLFREVEQSKKITVDVGGLAPKDAEEALNDVKRKQAWPRTYTASYHGAEFEMNVTKQNLDKKIQKFAKYVAMHELKGKFCSCHSVVGTETIEVEVVYLIGDEVREDMFVFKRVIEDD